MSLDALKWAIHYEVKSASHRLVLIALANFANVDGRAFPSVTTICGITMQHDETVRKALDELCVAGAIADTGQRAGVTQQTKVYQLPPDASYSHNSKAPENRGLVTAKGPGKPGSCETAKTKGKTREDPGKAPENRDRTNNQDSPIGEYKLPPELDNPQFRKAWNAWVADRKERKKPLTKEAVKRQLSKLKTFGSDRAVAAIDFSIMNSYQGIYEENQGRGRSGNGRHPIDRNAGTLNNPDDYAGITSKL